VLNLQWDLEESQRALSDARSRLEVQLNQKFPREEKSVEEILRGYVDTIRNLQEQLKVSELSFKPRLSPSGIVFATRGEKPDSERLRGLKEGMLKPGSRLEADGDENVHPANHAYVKR